MADDMPLAHAQAFAGKLQPGSAPALLLVDMVVAYLDPGSPLYCETAPAALAAAARLLAAAREAGRPIAFTNVAYQPGGADGGLFYRKVPALRLFEAGGALGAFPTEASPLAGEGVFTKQYPSAFFGTEFGDWLTERDVDTVVICGYSTSGCVRASALDTLQHGFVPLVVRDGCADRDPGPHEANLYDLQAKYAEVIGVDQALSVLRG